MVVTNKRVKIADNAMIHGGRYGYVVDGGLPPVTGWVCVKMDNDKALGQWFPPSKVEPVKD